MDAVLDRVSAPTARALEFGDEPSMVTLGWRPTTERLTLSPGITPVAPITLSPAAVDAFIAQVAHHYGHDPDRLNGARIGLRLRVPRADAHAQGRMLVVRVRRERRGPGFIARPTVSRAFGSGATIGEAFCDCLDDFMERLRLFEAERERLGPGPRQELDAIRHWLDAAS